MVFKQKITDEQILKALKDCAGNVVNMSHELKVSPQAVYFRLKKLEVK